MNKENKVISLGLAKKIHDKAIEKGFELPESEMWWGNTIGQKDQTCWRLYTNKVKEIPDTAMEYYRAYDIAELREMIGKKMIETYMNAGKVSVMSYGHPQFDEDTFAEAMGKMFYYLLNNDLL